MKAASAACAGVLCCACAMPLAQLLTCEAVLMTPV
jgi:hypothetical protein